MIQNHIVHPKLTVSSQGSACNKWKYSAADRPDGHTIGLPTDTIGLPADTNGLPTDTTGLPTDTTGLPTNTAGPWASCGGHSCRARTLYDC